MTQTFVDAVLYDSTPDVLGELVRDIVFLADGGKGVERNLEFIPEAKRIEDIDVAMSFWNNLTDAIYAEMNPEPDPDEDLVEASMTRLADYVFSDGLRVQVAWLWDGDMCLGIRVVPKEGNTIYLLNTDAKKDYGWDDATVDPQSSEEMRLTEKIDSSFSCGN